MEIEARALRDAFGAFLTGVTVVTTVNEKCEPIGFTANSFTSVSLDPPLLLVCLAKTSRNREAFLQAKGFAVNILSETQKDLSNTFARPVADRFAEVQWQRGPFGSPVFADVAAWFDCSLHNAVDAGDHYALFGRIEEFENSGKQGLGYSRGGYFTPTLAEKSLLANIEGNLVLSLVAQCQGQILLVPDEKGGWTLPSVKKTAHEGLDQVEQLFARQLGLTVDMGLLYSVYDDNKSGLGHVIYRADLGEGELGAGRFFAMDDVPLDDIRDSAIRVTVKRFTQESSLGNFGIYFGNQDTGYVHAVAAKKG